MNNIKGTQGNNITIIKTQTYVLHDNKYHKFSKKSYSH